MCMCKLLRQGMYSQYMTSNVKNCRLSYYSQVVKFFFIFSSSLHIPAFQKKQVSENMGADR
jgi:hypothetical protein